jgi:hypothetical protein
MKTKYAILFFLACLLILLIILEHKFPEFSEKTSLLPTPKPAVLGEQTLGTRTKSKECHKRGALPDPECTPGDIFPNITEKDICVSGYAKSVRNVTDATKKKIYEAYGIKSTSSELDKVDHLISLQLGGSNELANLWPTNKNDYPGAKEKDLIENYLHDQICLGNITLKAAQGQIANDWIYIYTTVFRPQ